jgi:two-component system OmpR family response regulator
LTAAGRAHHDHGVRVLIVEDDRTIADFVAAGLRQEGFVVDVVDNGVDGLDLAQSQPYAAAVIDVMLPRLDGLSLVTALRRKGVTTPVLFLSARHSVDDRVKGLQTGGDDYLIKPFAFPELTARLEAICRRASARPSSTLAEGPLTLDLTTRRVTRGGQEINLTPTEFSLLEYLMRYHGQVVTRKMLCEHLWEADWEGVTNVIEVHINRLRSKVDRDFDQPLIQTVRGRGYVLRQP